MIGNNYLSRRGFTIFFATLVGSLSLAVGIAIFELTIRELDLSQVATQSQFAIYAADVGAECALYWDTKCPTTGGPVFCTRTGGSMFATSSGSGSGVPANSNITCNALDITDPDAADAAYVVAGNASAATTTFSLKFTAQGKPYCTNVTVAKSGNPAQTTITSRGYNTCTSGAVLQLERSLKVTY